MRTAVKTAEGAGCRQQQIKQRPRKLTMEQYLDFIHSHKQLDISVNHLRQSVLIEMVKSLELMDLSRSTLQDDGVSSEAFLSLDDVTNDLNELKWQDCGFTSLQTINSAKFRHQHNSGRTVFSAASRKLNRSRKRFRKLASIGGSKDSVSPSLNVGGSEKITSLLTSWGPRKKKRTVKYVNLIGELDGGIVNFGIGVAASVARQRDSSSAHL